MPLRLTTPSSGSHATAAEEGAESNSKLFIFFGVCKHYFVYFTYISNLIFTSIH